MKIIEKKAFKIAMMNYTTLINIGAPVPENETYAVDVYDEETVKADVEKAKAEADIVMVYLHSGVEYQSEPDKATKQRIEYLASLGVDVVIGTHPHVIRPYGEMERPDGKKMLVCIRLKIIPKNWRQKAEYRKPRGRNTRWRRSKRILNHI